MPADNAALPSPALLTFHIEAVRTASSFMFVHSAFIPVFAAPHLLAAKDLPDELRSLLSDAERVRVKFEEDHTPESFHRLCDEIWLCRSVESFLRYLSAVLYEVFVQRPETLKSSDTVKTSEVLSFSSLDDLVHHLAEKKVLSLGYGSFDGLLAFLTNTLGLPFILSEDAQAPLREVIEVRNIIVHNGGRVNSLFLRRTKRTDLDVGARFPLTQDYVLAVNKTLRVTLAALDVAFVSHFRLSFRHAGATPCV